MRVTVPVLLLSLSACLKGQIGDDLAAEPAPPLDPTRPPPPSACEGKARDVGRVTLHRLNRAEYNNTVHDLLGTTARPADDFPNDDHGYGFDNIADVLSVAPLLVDKYQLAAEALAEAVLAKPASAPMAQRFEAERLTGTAGGDYQGIGWNLYSNGDINATFNAPAAGQYEIEVLAFQQAGGPDPAQMSVAVDGAVVATFDVTAREPDFTGYKTTLTGLRAGGHSLVVSFLNDFYDPAAGQDRNLVVDAVAVTGPLDVMSPPTNPELYARLVICDPAALGEEPCLRQILERFARRAYRRPLEAGELDRLVALARIPIQEGDGFERGLRLAVEAILLSPHFVFRVELDPDPASLDPHPLGAHELASRLSYFLWSSMPDEALIALADSGALLDPDTLGAEVQRMLADPRSRALVDNFAGQWLYTRGLGDVSPDYATYPSWDETLGRSMRAETELLFGEFLGQDVDVLDMLDVGHSFLDDRLATHYGLPPVGSTTPVRVELGDGQRRGLLGHGSLLTVTSRPKRTSPVKRGKWLLEQVLCSPPPAPPPGVEGLVETATAGSVRQRLEAHRQNPVCASCHETMDNLGFALENYDGVGAWRTTDGAFAVDASGRLPDGRSFAGPRELAQVLREDPRSRFCVSNRLFTYGLGRGVEPTDTCNLFDVTQAAQASGGSLADVLQSLVTHPSFTHRRGEAP